MAKTDIWATVHGERKALIADLQSLTDDQWSATSMCSNWSVHDVVAHMTATAKITPGSFFPKLAGSGFSLGRLQAKDIAAERGATPADGLARFEAVVDSTKHPPGPLDTMLGETIIHSEDIRRALGIAHEYPTASVVQVADFFKGSNLILGTKKRIAGLRLQATDAEWSTGDGPLVSGPVLSLLLAMTGRKAAVADRTGDGAETLASRP